MKNAYIISGIDFLEGTEIFVKKEQKISCIKLLDGREIWVDSGCVFYDRDIAIEKHRLIVMLYEIKY